MVPKAALPWGSTADMPTTEYPTEDQIEAGGALAGELGAACVAGAGAVCSVEEPRGLCTVNEEAVASKSPPPPGPPGEGQRRSASAKPCGVTAKAWKVSCRSCSWRLAICWSLHACWAATMFFACWSAFMCSARESFSPEAPGARQNSLGGATLVRGVTALVRSKPVLATSKGPAGATLTPAVSGCGIAVAAVAAAARAAKPSGGCVREVSRLR
mmetsp:Transcript_12130/g.34760  ORF Transcript_12130/g.34760 Transcript_12130/m.34760 type:complete len:214 (+) Transcript_12130:489-1130(+)